ncbi:MAG: aspartyl protease family protein [Oscillospiraceae bacterium]|nr:aspartyl protease family protein [Oscillospiraceae bacterium]
MLFKPDTAAPFELVDGIVLLPGTAEGAKGHFALDTGATQTVLNRRYCTRSGEASDDAVTFSGSEQSSAAVKLDAAEISFAGITIRLDAPTLLDMSYVEQPLRNGGMPSLRFLGSIGANHLCSGRLVVDYPARRVVFNASAVPAHTREVSMSVETVPVIELDLGAGPQRFALDTGANHFAIDQNAAARELLDAAPVGMPRILPPFRFAGREYAGLDGLVADLAGICEALRVDGIFGYQLLRDSVCCFDFDAGRLYLT